MEIESSSVFGKWLNNAAFDRKRELGWKRLWRINY